VRKRPATPVTRAVGACIGLSVAACAGAGHQPVSHLPTQQPQTANPAARKCLEDGYKLEPVLGADGLPVDHDCVDPTSGKRCEVWDYFRRECRLRDAAQP
jgi:putative hemolysin